jgi:hypothetical protein
MAEATTKTVAQLAFADLIDSLAGIDAGDTPPAPAVGAGVTYRNSLTPVVVDTLDGDGLRDDRVYVFKGNHIPQPSPLGKQDWHLAVVVVCVATPPANTKLENRPAPMDLLESKLADVMLATAPERVRTGGHIINVLMEGDDVEFEVGSSPYAVVIPLRLHVRHARNDPYSL